jgi:hypothetical protein
MIQSKPSTPLYRKNWDRVFRNRVVDSDGSVDYDATQETLGHMVDAADNTEIQSFSATVKEAVAAAKMVEERVIGKQSNR